MDLYDEFGNYIGPEDDSDEEGQQQTSYLPTESAAPLEGLDQDGDVHMDDALPRMDGFMEEDDRAAASGPISNAVVLHEDKRYYPHASELYGDDVEALVQEEDLQPLSEPIIAPVKALKFRVVDNKASPITQRFENQFLLDLAAHIENVRNVAVVGHLHHGKTALMDMLVYETHQLDWEPEKQVRAHVIFKIDCTLWYDHIQLQYTDSHVLAQQRGISLKSSPMSFVLQNTKGKSYLLNMIDTPGHVNFQVSIA